MLPWVGSVIDHKRPRPMIRNRDSGIREIFACGIRILGFGIRNTAQGVRNPTNVWNPESITWNPESTAWNLDFLTWGEKTDQNAVKTKKGV